MKERLALCLAMVLLLPACQLFNPPASSPSATTNSAPMLPSRGGGRGKCGDGICSGPETRDNCPSDCIASTANTPAHLAASPSTSSATPMFLTTMTHMESGWSDDIEEAIFLQHVEQLRYGLRLADEYGAKFTIESETPFAKGAEIWGINILHEVLQRGHGVGTHSDVSPRRQYSLEELTREFMERKTLVDALVGAQNNRGTSGGGCPGDWVTAAHQAGFLYMDGVVGMHYLGMPLEARPGPLWTDEYILSVGYHTDVPLELKDRIYPFLLTDTQDLVPDPNGILLILSGDIGRLDSMAEGGSKNCPGKTGCPLTNEDTDLLIDQIRLADSIRDRTRIAKLTIYIPANAFVETNETGLRYFLQKMKDLADQGVIVWATQGQVYDAYMAG